MALASRGSVRRAARLFVYLPFVWLVASSLYACAPFALPPLRGQFGGASATPLAAQERNDSPEPSAEDVGTLIGRVGVHPLQLIRDAGDRLIDVGAGYGGETVERGNTGRHGPYAEVALFPFRTDAGSGRRVRAGVLTIGEYFVGPDAAYRGGATVAATAELTGFSSGSFATEDAVGVAHGEWAVGLFAGPSLRHGDAGTAWSGTLGISARVPLTFGFVCCLDPDIVRDKHSKSRKRERRKTSKGATNEREGRSGRKRARDKHGKGGRRMRRGRGRSEHRGRRR